MQQLVDGLARRLSRTVAVDDRDIRLVAYSSHEGVAVDPLRQYSILNRRVPPAVARYVTEQAGDGLGPFRIPPAPDLGMELARICVPVRDSRVVYGWLTLFEDEGPLGEAELSLVAETARLATIAFRQEASGDRVTERLRDLLPVLIDGDDAERRRAALELIESDLFVPAEPVTAIVVTPQSPDGVHDQDRTSLKVALEHVSHSLPTRRRISHVRSDHAVLLLAAGDMGVDGWDAGTVAKAVQEAADGELAGVWVGIGSPAAGLETARESYLQARQAAEVARVVAAPSRVLSHAELGIYALLARIPAAERTRAALPPSLVRLLALGEPGRVYVGTVETFLDRAGNAKVAAEALNIHRATLYYRLNRVEEVAGIDLNDGNERLVLHVGLKLARLIGELG
jgi:hypothetical protein